MTVRTLRPMAADRATPVPDGPSRRPPLRLRAWLGECGEIDHVELLLGRADARTPTDGERKPAARETWADVTGKRGGECGAYCFCHLATRMLQRPSRRRRVARCNDGAFVNDGVHCAKQATAPRPVVPEQPEQAGGAHGSWSCRECSSRTSAAAGRCR